MTDLIEVLAEARGDAAVLDRAGNTGQAQYIVALCDKVRDSARDYMTWLEERDAKLKSGWTDRTCRRRFAEYLECGLARWSGDVRQFRACAVPPRANVDAARARGAQVVTR